MSANATPAPVVVAMRLLGFFAAAIGALVAGLGTLQEWVEVGLQGNPADVISPGHLGVELPEGKIVLALAVVALIAVLGARIGRAGSRRTSAMVVLIAGFGIVGLTTLATLTIAGRLERDAAEELAFPGAGLSNEPIAEITKLLDGRTRSGIWSTTAGGAGVVVGGLLTLAWARRAAMAPEPSMVPPDVAD